MEYKNKNAKIPNVTNTKYFNQSAQILFGVDKKISTTQNAHCLLPSTTATTTYYYYYYYYWDPHNLSDMKI